MRLRVPRWALAAAAGAAFAVCGAAAPVRAHATLDSSAPVASSVLSSPPDRVVLTFSEDINPSLSSIRLFGPDADEIALGPVSVASGRSQVVSASVPEIAQGTYVVVWRVTSVDGHPVSGAFPFEIGPAATGRGEGLTESVLARIAVSSSLGWPLGLARLAAFVGFMGLLGVLALSRDATLLASSRAAAAALGATVVSLAGTAGVLLLQGAHSTGGGWGAVGDPALVGDVLRSRTGIALVARAALFGGWALAFVRRPRERWTPRAVATAGLLAALTAATFSWPGHPGAAGREWFFVPLDTVHLVAAGAWVGGLVLLAVRLGGPGSVVTAALFSRTATVAMPVAVLTGVVQAFHLVDGRDVLTGSTYGRLLIAKVVTVMVVLAAASAARRSLRRDAAPRGAATVRIEALVAAAVICLTAGLLANSPVVPAPRPAAHEVSLVAGGILADFVIDPAATGTAEVHVTLSPPGGAIERVLGVEVSLALRERSIDSLPVAMTELGPNHWSGTVQIPYPGAWTLEARVTPAENTVVRYATGFEVTQR